MKKFNKVNFILSISLALLETIIYVLFLLDDFLNIRTFDNTQLKYLSIIILVAFSMVYLIYLIFRRQKELYDNLHLTIALLFTLLADTFLLLINDLYEIGLIFFIITQIFYFVRIIRLNHLKTKTIINNICIRLVAFTVVLTVIIIIDLVSLVNLLSAFYFINLIVNFITTFILFLIKHRKTNLVFSIGLFLFILCDISVGLYNLFSICSNLMWFFYLPSQVVITLSGLKDITYEKIK